MLNEDKYIAWIEALTFVLNSFCERELRSKEREFIKNKIKELQNKLT